ncbi:MAG: twin-arginine translocase TatA/TatE family subunit [Anaerolineae bacterium]|jgi:sec-independent protein translocase protein TatA|nr:twin-arginine translocase TatA/TatE family subunit [Anaerolineae bacterium]
MPFRLGVPELLIVLVIVVLLFGVGRLTKIAGELGGGIRAFRKGVQGDEVNDDEKTEEDESKK